MALATTLRSHTVIPAHSISIDRCHLPVTASLHGALLRLRDQLIERVIWIRAICIDQGNTKERGHQVQSMAEIYCIKANRVIVRLGEATVDSDRALKNIRIAADEESKKALK